jgi:hypothetical protein
MSTISGGETKKPMHCSFCGKGQHEVRKLIAGADRATGPATRAHRRTSLAPPTKR